jgi:hypothetical protein
LGDKGNYLLIVANAGSGFGRVTSGCEQVKHGPWLWCGRVACGANNAPHLRVGIADRAGRFNCMSVGSAIAAITLLVWIKCTTFPALVVVSLVFGIATGGNISLQPVCTAQVTPDQRLVGTMIGQLWGGYGGRTGLVLLDAYTDNRPSFHQAFKHRRCSSVHRYPGLYSVMIRLNS